MFNTEFHEAIGRDLDYEAGRTQGRQEIQDQLKQVLRDLDNLGAQYDYDSGTCLSCRSGIAAEHGEDCVYRRLWALRHLYVEK